MRKREERGGGVGGYRGIYWAVLWLVGWFIVYVIEAHWELHIGGNTKEDAGEIVTQFSCCLIPAWRIFFSSGRVSGERRRLSWEIYRKHTWEIRVRLVCTSECLCIRGFLRRVDLSVPIFERRADLLVCVCVYICASATLLLYVNVSTHRGGQIKDLMI